MHHVRVESEDVFGGDVELHGFSNGCCQIAQSHVLALTLVSDINAKHSSESQQLCCVFRVCGCGCVICTGALTLLSLSLNIMIHSSFACSRKWPLGVVGSRAGEGTVRRGRPSAGSSTSWCHWRRCLTTTARRWQRLASERGTTLDAMFGTRGMHCEFR